MKQTHGSNLWRESAGSGAVPIAVPMYVVRSGSDITLSAVGPAAFAFIDVDGAGDYRLVNLTPIDPDAGTYYDSAGAVVTVLATSPRLAALRVGGDVHFYPLT